MIKHCVFVKFRDEFGGAARADIFARLAGLVGDIEGMVDFCHGPNRDFEGRSVGFTDGFVASFASRGALALYADYPAHLALGSELVSMLQGGVEGLMVFDIEVG